MSEIVSKKLPKVVIVVGPTASGKTSLSLFLAETLQGEIISVDSRQVYKGLDIGTEKITAAEMRNIPHHLIDCREPAEIYTAATFVHDAAKIIEEISSRAHVPIVVGGTFFYVEALLGAKTLPHVAPNAPLRAELESLSTDILIERLKVLDPARAANIDTKNRRRLVRALEIVSALGAVPIPTKTEPSYDTYTIGIDVPADILRERIAKRLKQTLAKELIEETKRVLAGGLPQKRLMEIGLEYRVVIQYLNGEIPESKLEQTLIEKVWQYAKRQRMWLKKIEHVHWYTAEEREKILNDVETFLVH